MKTGSILRKNVITAGLVFLLGNSGLYAQGNINFFIYANATSKGNVWQYPPFPSLLPVDSNYVGQLFYSDVSATAPKSALSPIVRFDNSGTIAYGLVTDPSDDAGNYIWYSLAAWNPAIGATYAQAAANVVGPFAMSQTVQVLLGGVDVNQNLFTPQNSNGFMNFIAYTVPEPSSMVIGGIEAALLLLFHRLKSSVRG